MRLGWGRPAASLTDRDAMVIAWARAACARRGGTSARRRAVPEQRAAVAVQVIVRRTPRFRARARTVTRGPAGRARGTVFAGAGGGGGGGGGAGAGGGGGT